MIDYPVLKPRATGREMLDVFKGYNRNLRLKEGELRDMENLSSDGYPALTVRGKRSVVEKRDEVNTMLYCQGHGLFYTAGGSLFTPRGEIEGFYQRREAWLQQLVSMGSYLILFPEMRWVDTNLEQPDNPDKEYRYGDINALCLCIDKKVTFQLCREDGTVYTGANPSDTQPTEPEDGALWLDTSGKPHSLKQYSKAADQWVSISSTYVRISADDMNIQDLRQYDGVTISGIEDEALKDLNGSAVIWALGQGEGHESYIVVSGILDGQITQDCGVGNAISIAREAPAMDFIVEAGNRLWGCRYGMNNKGEFVNEIYCSKLGDFKNWCCYMGIATDSWAANVGAPGPFTGAANIDGCPVFYKENMRYKVWISSSGAHQINGTPCVGVEALCDRSVGQIDGAVIYKSSKGFCVDDGSGPVELADTIWAERYGGAVGCVHNGKYYVSMFDAENGRHLFVYDFRKKLWHREDGLRAGVMCSDGNSTLYAYNVFTGEILDLMGNRGALEGPVRWMAELGEMGLESPDRKYVSRLDLRLAMEVGAELTVYIRYDSGPDWEVLGSISGTTLRTFSLPLRLRRCDHFALRLEGVGDVKLYSITKTIMKGSDRR